MKSAHEWKLELNAVALLDAVLCADCEVISNSGGERCEVCGSPSLLSLGRVLGGCIEGERAALVETEPGQFRNGFTVLVNPNAAQVLHARRRRQGNGA